MNTKVYITAAAGTLLGSASPAFAASGSRGDSSGIIVWSFLGFCALIVIAQLTPLIRNLLAKPSVTADLEEMNPAENSAHK